MKVLNKDAFTLIELLVVIVILGILVLLASSRILHHVQSAKVAHIQNDVKIAELIMSEYLTNHDDYPDEWPDVSTAKLRNLASNSMLYDVDGYVSEVKDGSYKEIDIKLLKKGMKTNLGGKFYVNESSKVFYEDDDPSNIKYKDPLFDREVNEESIEQDKIKVLSHRFPNGVYKDGETMNGNIEVEGLKSGDYYIEIFYIHSKFQTPLYHAEELKLKEGEVKTLNFDYLVESDYLRGFYDFVLTIRDSSDDEALADYYVGQSIYFAETEWTYYYHDDFSEVDKDVAGQIGTLSSDRVSYDYVYEENAGIDYSSITFDVQPDSNESGQIMTKLPETYGTYEAMIKVPDNDALLNGFFLYGHNKNNSEVEHEVDIEILYQDGKWQVWGSIFNETHKDYVYNGVEPGLIYQVKHELNFDPSKDYHSYRIDFYDDFISFAVDGIEFGRWENRFDYGDMHLYAGNFYTHWLTGELSQEPLEMNVKWIRKGYFK